MLSSWAIASLSHASGVARPVSIFEICDSEQPTRFASLNCVHRFARRVVRMIHFLIFSFRSVRRLLLLSDGSKKNPAIQAYTRMAGNRASHLGNQASQVLFI